MENNKNDILKLVFVKPIYKNNESYIYDLYFSETPDDVWGIDWDYNNPSAIDSDDIIPDKTTYHDIERINIKMPLKTIQETTCYSMEYAIYNIIGLSWIDIENMDEYPENGRMVFYFNQTKNEIFELLKKCNILNVN